MYIDETGRMIVMKKARNVINKWGLSMFVALMLLSLAFGA